MFDLVKKSLAALRDPQAYEFGRQSSFLLNPPYPLEVYRELLTNLKASKGEMPAFIENGPVNSTTLYFRHDIDTLECMSRVMQMIDINIDLSVPAGVYFRVDAEEYSLEDHVDVVHEIAEAGFEVGLHTSCYVNKNPMEKLKNDTKRFEQATGLSPVSFTLHGLGSVRILSRLLFRSMIRRRLDEFGYRFTDCHRALRNYRYVVEDCHVDSATGERYLKTDVNRVGELVGTSGNILVLTHPCYWSP